MLAMGAALVLLCIGYTQYVTGSTQSTVSNTPSKPKPFSIIVLPDTQHYTMNYPAMFSQQTSWIAAHKDELNIVYATQLGDIVEIWDNQPQWEAASRSLSLLDGVVPYGIAPGNHDVSPQGDSPYFAQYFPMSRITAPALSVQEVAPNYRDLPRVGNYGYKNSYHLFEGGGKQFIAFNLEFCPDDKTVDWVNATLSRFSQRGAIIATHSFINADGERETADGSCQTYHAAGSNAAEDLWEKIEVEGKHDNVLLYLSGHDIWTARGAARRTDVVNGYPVHQLLSNYQEYPYGGNGYLRILQFDTDRAALNVSTYSPFLNAYYDNPDNHFELPLPLVGRFDAQPQMRRPFVR